MKTQNINTLILSIFFVILLFGFMSTSLARAEPENFSLVKQWNTSSNPKGLAFDKVLNNIYCLESNCIEIFDTNGTLIKKWDINVMGYDHTKRGIAVDSSGYVYVTDCDAFKVKKFDSNGSVEMLI